ncbi:MAG: response regulator transcription factor [Bacteroidota bacterium]
MPAKNKISILLADDHSLVRDGIKALLEDDDCLEVIEEAKNGEEAIRKTIAHQPDIVLMDIRMPVMNGLEAIAQLSKKRVSTKAIVLSMHDSEEYVLQSMEANAFGYLLKDAPKEELLRAIYRVYEGEKYYSGDISKVIVNKYLEKINTPNRRPLAIASKLTKISLTKRERQIMDLVLSGMSNKEIAEQLNKSVRTVEAHRFNLMKKLEVKNVTELAQKVEELSL